MKKIMIKFKLYLVILIIFMVILIILNSTMIKFTKSPELKRGINLGNMFESPWGEGTIESGDNPNLFKDEYVKIIKNYGFDFVRLPVAFSIYADVEAPYKIEDGLFNKIDYVINLFLNNGLTVILDLHGYDEINFNKDPRYNPMRDPSNPQYNPSIANEVDVNVLPRINRKIDILKEKERFKGIWLQIANHYKNYEKVLLFELLNEPSVDINLYNKLIKDTISIIRNTGSNNKNRDIVVSPTWYSTEWGLLKYLDIPKNDKHIIGTFHLYNPFDFTHQGFTWAAIKDPKAKYSWEETEENTKEIKKIMNEANAWSKKTGLKVLMGEFGAGQFADMNSRVAWTNYVARLAEKNGFVWAYWDFCTQSFGFYNRSTNAYHSEIYKALFPNK